MKMMSNKDDSIQIIGGNQLFWKAQYNQQKNKIKALEQKENELLYQLYHIEAKLSTKESIGKPAISLNL